MKNYFSEREIDSYTKIVEEKKSEWLAARLSVKKALHSFLLDNHNKNISLKRIQILKTKSNRPVCKLPFKLDAKINISLSHCGGIGFSVVSGSGLVGCDIEKIRNFEYNTLMAFLTKKELKTVIRAEPLIKPFLATLLWSLKESYLKAIGTGLTKHPKSVEIKINFKKRTGELRDNGTMAPVKMEWSIFKKKYILTKVDVFKI